MGDDSEVLALLAEEAKSRLEGIDGLMDNFASKQQGQQELHVALNRELTSRGLEFLYRGWRRTSGFNEFLPGISSMVMWTAIPVPALQQVTRHVETIPEISFIALSVHTGRAHPTSDPSGVRRVTRYDRFPRRTLRTAQGTSRTVVGQL